MASRRARRQGPRLFEGPVLFSRLRSDIAELAGFVWLAVEVGRLVRSKFAKAPGALTP
ncbi:MAG: hypothetical protein ACJ75L_08815 [Gaiellaceae bacterium]